MSKIYFHDGNKQTKRSTTLTIGACLALFAGLLRILDGILLLAADKTIFQLFNPQSSNIISLNTISHNLLISGILAIVIGLIAVLGGIYALKRKYFMLALILGGIFAFISDPFFVFGLLAFVLIAFSRRDFD